MAKQSERHPKLLKALELSEGGGDVETLAQRVGVSVRTVRRDIAALRELGLAIEEHVAAHGRKTYSLKPNALSLRLTYDEAVAVLWHCEQTPSLVETPWGESLSIGVKKIRELLGPIEKRYVDRMLPRMHRTRHAADYRDRGEELCPSRSPQSQTRAARPARRRITNLLHN